MAATESLNQRKKDLDLQEAKTLGGEGQNPLYE